MRRDGDRLPRATVVAIVALWFHVALAAVFLTAGAMGLGGSAAPELFGAIWGVGYALTAIGLQQRYEGARQFGIVAASLSYLFGIVMGGRVISTTLLILVPLLWPQPRDAYATRPRPAFDLDDRPPPPS